MHDSRAGASGRLPVLRMFPAVAALVVATALTGCQSNPEPPPLETAPSASPSPSSTEPTSEPAPTMPAEAEGPSRAAAKAFVRHFFDVLNHAMNSGETAELRRLSAPGCQSCEAIAGNIESTYSAGGNIQSDGWRLQSVTPVPSQPAVRAIMDLGVLMTTERVTKNSDSKPESFRGGKQPMTIHLSHTDEGWRVERLDRVS